MKQGFQHPIGDSPQETNPQEVRTLPLHAMRFQVVRYANRTRAMALRGPAPVNITSSVGVSGCEWTIPCKKQNTGTVRANRSAAMAALFLNICIRQILLDSTRGR